MLLSFRQAVEKARAAGWSWEATRQFVADCEHLMPHGYCVCGEQYALSVTYTGDRIPQNPIFCSDRCGSTFAGTPFFSVAGSK